jgi:uncharacterized protein YraI
MKFLYVGALALAAAISAASAMAEPGVVHTTVNLREGPGTSTPVVAKIPGGSSVDVANCSGEWCQVSFQGKSGYVIATSLSGSAAGSLRAGSPRGVPPGAYPAPQGAYPAPQPANAYPYAYPGYPYPYYGYPYYYGYGPYWGWRRRWFW